MDKKQFEAIHATLPEDRLFRYADLQSYQNRTLLYGYTSRDHNTWHVYADAATKNIHRVVYNSFRRLIEHTDVNSGTLQTNADYIPSKRLYPEACDAGFCQMLKLAGVRLPFTTWDDERYAKRMNGQIDNTIGSYFGLLHVDFCGTCDVAHIPGSYYNHNFVRRVI